METTTENQTPIPSWELGRSTTPDEKENLYESRASFGIRYRAWSIDLMVAMGIGVVFSLAANRVFRSFLEKRFASFLEAPSRVIIDDLMGYYGFLIGLVVGLLCVLFLIACIEAVWGITPGKKILRLAIRHASGMPADRITLLLRGVVKYLPALFAILALGLRSGLFGLLAMIGSLVIGAGSFMALGQRRQTLHDRIAETAVYPQGMPLPKAIGETPWSPGTHIAPSGTSEGSESEPTAQM